MALCATWIFLFESNQWRKIGAEFEPIDTNIFYNVLLLNENLILQSLDKSKNTTNI